MTQWVWQHPEWPHFTWKAGEIEAVLGQARLAQGTLLGTLSSLGFEAREQLTIQALTDEMITTSAIEGVTLDRDSVRSSIYHRLGLDYAGYTAKPDRHIEGLLDILLDAADHFNNPLNSKRVQGWHAALFPTGYSGIHKILVAQWRGAGDMKIISGRGNKISIHYIAPPYENIPAEMETFFDWFNEISLTKPAIDGLLRAAIAHFWFEKLHPFDDGNGRIGRAIIDLSLAQDEQQAMRFYSISAAIMEQRKGYYDALEISAKNDLDITLWITWFLNCFIKAINVSLQKIEITRKKQAFWQAHTTTVLNERQRKILTKMLDKGVEGFVGGMTTRKYMNLTTVSRATAYRELADLVAKQCLQPMGAQGRSSAYEIHWPS